MRRDWEELDRRERLLMLLVEERGRMGRAVHLPGELELELEPELLFVGQRLGQYVHLPDRM